MEHLFASFKKTKHGKPFIETALEFVNKLLIYHHIGKIDMEGGFQLLCEILSWAIHLAMLADCIDNRAKAICCTIAGKFKSTPKE